MNKLAIIIRGYYYLIFLKSKIFKKSFTAFGFIFLGFILLLVVFVLSNHTSSSLPIYFSPLLVTFSRVGYSFIIAGILLFLNINDYLSNLFLPSDNQLDFDQFKRNEAYILKIGPYFIQRHNREVIIHFSNKKLLKFTFLGGLILAFLLFIASPLLQLFLANLSFQSPLYHDSNSLDLVLFVFILLCFIFIVGMYFFVSLFVLLHRTVIILDPVSHVIHYQRNFVYPLKIFFGGIQELTIPLGKIKSLELNSESFKSPNLDLNDFRRYNTFELQFLTLSTGNWHGNQKLFKQFRSRSATNRIKFLSDTNIHALSDIKTFFIDYAKNNYNF